jgi:hypothetical protein
VLLERAEVAEVLEPKVEQLVGRALSLLEDPVSRPRAESAAAELREMLGPAGAASRIAESLLGIVGAQPVSAIA